MKYYMFDGLGANKPKKNKSKFNNRKLNKKKVLKLSIILVIIVLIITGMIFYTENKTFKDFCDKYIFRKDVYDEKLPTIEEELPNSSNIYAYNGSIVVQNQNVLSSYNKYADKEYTLDIQITTPLFESNGNFLCIAEKDGHKIYLISGRNVIWQKDIEGNISNISVNSNGYVTIAISGTSYKTVIETFDPNGTELFKTYLSTTNIIDAEISNDNKYLAIAEANFSGIIIQSSVKIISIEEAKGNSSSSIIYTYTADSNDMITNIKYQSKNNLACMYDGHIDIIKDNQNTKITSFTNEEALFADIDLSNNVVEVIKKSTGMFSADAQVKIIDTSNKKEKIYSLEQVPKSIYVYRDIIAINLGTEALIINDNGWLVKRYNSSQEIQKIVLCNDLVGIISKNKVQIISL